MTSEEVCEWYNAGGAESFESTALVLVERDVVVKGNGPLKHYIPNPNQDLDSVPVLHTFEQLQIVPSCGFCFHALREKAIDTS